MLHRVVSLKLTDVSEVLTKTHRPIMEAVSISETSVNFYETTRRNILEDSRLHIEGCYGSKKVTCPATRHGGAWGERKYSSYSFLTSALDGGEWSASRPGRAFPPEKGPPLPIVQEAGWATGVAKEKQRKGS
jgi:hypothetical protein